MTRAHPRIGDRLLGISQRLTGRALTGLQRLKDADHRVIGGNIGGAVIARDGHVVERRIACVSDRVRHRHFILGGDLVLVRGHVHDQRRFENLRKHAVLIAHVTVECIDAGGGESDLGVIGSGGNRCLKGRCFIHAQTVRCPRGAVG